MNKIRQNAAELMLVLSIAVIIVWYMMDAYAASSKVANLLLIVPIGVISLGFLFAIAIRILPGFLKPEEGDSPTESKKEEQTRENGKKIFLAMALLALYVLIIPTIGFDIATFLFIGVMMFVQGERKWAWLIVFPLIFSFLVSQFFSAMIPYPMPMAIQQEWITGLI